jgi:hypothetical protein
MAPSSVALTKEQMYTKIHNRFYFLISVLFPRVALATEEALKKQVC